jgi:hypothetical protein
VDALESEWRRLEDDLAVVRWRTDRLIALGYELREAAFLAIAGVDIHELERLVVKGCPPATAIRIAG